MDTPVSRNENRPHVIWGGLLILLGVLSLVEVFFDLKLLLWAGIMGVAGLGFLGLYLSTRREPALLIPVYICWAVGGLLLVIALNILQDAAIAYYVLTAIAFPFIVGWLLNRHNWGLLIPAYVLLAVCGVVFLSERRLIPGEFIATYILSAIALPFLIGWATNPKERWGLLIPAYVLLAVGAMVGLIGLNVLRELLIPSYIMFAIAVPFLYVFVRSPQNWWALIPGGIMSVIGLGFLLSAEAVRYVVPVAFILGGLVLIGWQFVGRRESVAAPLPVSGPEADKPRE